jgi:hypothetical protein
VARIKKIWSKYSIDAVKEAAEDNFGVYEIASKDKKLLYVGQGHVQAGLVSHLKPGKNRIVGASYYRFEYTGGKAKAVARKNRMLKDWKAEHGDYPAFNDRLA